MSVVQIGGNGEVVKWLKLANKQLESQFPDAKPLTAQDFQRDTILVTYYNAPNVDQLRAHYEHLPEQLERENICPEIPWLYSCSRNRDCLKR